MKICQSLNTLGLGSCRLSQACRQGAHVRMGHTCKSVNMQVFVPGSGSVKQQKGGRWGGRDLI